MTTPESSDERQLLTRRLVDVFRHQGFEVKGARELADYPPPPLIKNLSYGSMTPRRPDVIGFDHERHRIVFGLVRLTRAELDSEDALEEYNLFLDQNVDLEDRAAAVYVLMPSNLITEFTGIITHYIHREYWNRIIPVASETPGG